MWSMSYFTHNVVDFCCGGCSFLHTVRWMSGVDVCSGVHTINIQLSDLKILFHEFQSRGGDGQKLVLLLH